MLKPDGSVVISDLHTFEGQSNELCPYIFNLYSYKSCIAEPFERSRKLLRHPSRRVPRAMDDGLQDDTGRFCIAAGPMGAAEPDVLLGTFRPGSEPA